MEFPLAAKTYLFCLDGTMFKHLKDQESSYRKAFLANIAPLVGSSAQIWYDWCQVMEIQCVSYRIFVLPYECHDVCDSAPRGFIVGDPEVDTDAHIGNDYITYIND